MNLFQALPENLFSILVSKNKVLYVEALFVLRNALKQEMTIEKGDLIGRIVAQLGESDFIFDDEEEPDELDQREAPSGSPSSAAHFILRRFINTGWVELEYQVNSFEEIITIPPYARKLLDLLYSFTDESMAEYNSYVYATYSSLNTADRERNEFIYNAFFTAYDNTLRLVDELKNLYHNIRRYHQILNEYATANDILVGHFDEYKALLMDRVYHPLKTLDAVPRFKIPIIKILNKWIKQLSVREMIAEQGVLRGKYPSKEEAMEDIILKLGEIVDIYEGIDEMLEEIDRKNSAYTKASIEKMRYLLNTDRSIKGKLAEILSASGNEEFVAGAEGQASAFAQRMQKGIKLYRQGYISNSSMFVRKNRKEIRSEKPMELAYMDKEFGDAGLAAFIERAGKLYSEKRVLRFMEELMDGKDVVNSQDISLKSDEDFIFLMLGTLKRGEKGMFYDIQFEEGYCEKNGYRIPDMHIVRKKGKGAAGHVDGTI